MMRGNTAPRTVYHSFLSRGQQESNSLSRKICPIFTSRTAVVRPAKTFSTSSSSTLSLLLQSRVATLVSAKLSMEDER